jgi:hypothetical protein
MKKSVAKRPIVMAQFKHVCGRCVYLGPFADSKKVKYDLYYCSERGKPAVIARYGDEGWEYMSGWRSTILDPMSEAVRRAESLNLKGPK